MKITSKNRSTKATKSPIAIRNWDKPMERKASSATKFSNSAIAFKNSCVRMSMAIHILEHYTTLMNTDRHLGSVPFACT